MNQPELFDTSRTIPTACPCHGCDAIRQPGQDKADGCAVETERTLREWVRRPDRCLNTIRPEHNDVPY